MFSWFCINLICLKMQCHLGFQIDENKNIYGIVTIITYTKNYNWYLKEVTCSSSISCCKIQIKYIHVWYTYKCSFPVYFKFRDANFFVLSICGLDMLIRFFKHILQTIFINISANIFFANNLPKKKCILYHQSSWKKP